MEKRLKGLTSDEAEKKLIEHGFNEIKDPSKISSFKILLRQIKNNFMVYLLFIALIISFFVGKNVTGYALLVVIIMVIGIGFIQEYRAEKAIKTLKKLVMPISIVIRNGDEVETPSKNLVPGDILILRTGERIPADCTIIEEKSLLVDESILTGESKEVEKHPLKNSEDYTDKNTLFTGSFILSGRCIAKVIKTGMDTRFGKIARLISTAEKELPLQEKANKIAKYMAIMAITIAVLTGSLILLRQPITTEIVVEVLILIIALSVAAFPEGLPVVLITTLSVGAFKMSRKNAIVNRISIIETLGETTIICSDKTGTITKGEMTVKKIFTDNSLFEVSGTGYSSKGGFTLGKENINVGKEKILNLLLKASALCNDAIIQRTRQNKEYSIFGSPTEAALSIMSAKANIFREDIKSIREQEIPFSSERKIMTVLNKEQKGKYVYSKGALEILLKSCKYIQRKDGKFRLLEKDKKRILEEEEKLTSSSLRTIALAYKKVSCDDVKCFEEDLIFLGIVGMEDPPREEIRDALITCKNAGIKVKMITGDNKETALSIARQVGLDEGEHIEGKDIDKLTDNELLKVVKNVSVFSRVRPEHKLRIVRALKENGEIVTMTGDGVNDAPALKEAHIGVAMGKNGTDVSRSVADLTLKDDNFATIVDAIKEGRSIFNNIRKFVTFQLSCNYAELAILFFGVLLSPILGWPIPILLALHILFMNLVTDNLPAITLGFNPSSTDIMSEKPRKKAQILTKNLIWLIILSGTIMTIFTLGVFLFTFNILNQGIVDARTTTLIALVVIEIALAFNFRSFRKKTLTRSPFVNKYLLIASLVSIIATVLIVYTPLNQVFGTIPVPLLDWIIAFGFAVVLIFIFDILKKINEKKHFWSSE